jgi:hypothetical protein
MGCSGEALAASPDGWAEGEPASGSSKAQSSPKHRLALGLSEDETKELFWDKATWLVAAMATVDTAVKMMRDTE